MEGYVGKMARTGLLFVIAAAFMIGAPLFTGVLTASAQTADPCARQNERLAQTGRGDRDFDGISNCTEKKVLGTSHRDPDSDDDGLDDGDEVADGTDPLDPDSDNDGINDGDENDNGTDPLDSDSDDDGIDDNNDPDPINDLRDQIEGDLDAITCPTQVADGSITILGIDITITASTEFDGAETCDDLAARFAADGGAHVQVEVTGDLSSGFTAKGADLEDADNDGSPDHIDNDDDNDGVPDDQDIDDDGDDVPDEEDNDDDSN